MRILLILCLTVFSSGAWAQEVYHNPVDGKDYVADQWETYTPEGGVRESDSRVKNAGVRLLNSQQDISKNTTASELASLIKEIEALLTKSVAESEFGGEILLQVAMHKDKPPTYQMSYNGELQNDMLKDFYNALQQLKAVNSKESSINFLVHFVIDEEKT